MKILNIFLVIGVLVFLSAPSFAQKKKGYVEGEEVRKVQLFDRANKFPRAATKRS